MMSFSAVNFLAVNVESFPMGLVLSLGIAVSACGCSDGELSVTTGYDDLLIDDFEDGNISIDSTGGRQGGWFWYNDANDQEPAPADRSCRDDDPRQCMEVTATARENQTTEALHTAGGPGYDDWGAGAGVSLAVDFYDMSRFRGLRFWARAPDDARQQVRVNFSDRQTSERGGICDPRDDAPDDMQCNDHFGQLVFLGSSWRKFEVYFEDIAQKGLFGQQFDEFDETAVSDILFQFDSEMGAIRFELWLDDLELILE